MNGSDFYSRIAPWTKVVVASTPNIVPAGVSAVILAGVAAGFNRWILGFTGQDQNFAGGFVRLETSVNGVNIGGLGYQYQGQQVINKLLTNSTDTALVIRNISAVAVTPFFTLVYADTPPNVLSNLVVGQYAG